MEQPNSKRRRLTRSVDNWREPAHKLVDDMQRDRHLGERKLVYDVQVVPGNKRFAEITLAEWDSYSKTYVPSAKKYLVCRPADCDKRTWFEWCNEPPWSPGTSIRVVILEAGVCLRSNHTDSDAATTKVIAYKQSHNSIAHQLLHDKNRNARPFFELIGNSETISSVIEGMANGESELHGIELVPESSGVSQLNVGRPGLPKLSMRETELRVSTGSYMRAAKTFTDLFEWLLDASKEQGNVSFADCFGFGNMVTGTQQLILEELRTPIGPLPYVMLVNPLMENDKGVQDVMAGVQSRFDNDEEVYNSTTVFHMPHFNANHEQHLGYPRPIHWDEFESHAENFERELRSVRANATERRCAYVNVVLFAAQCYHTLSGLLTLGVLCNEIQNEPQRCPIKLSLFLDSGDWIGGGVGGVYSGCPWINAYQNTSVARRVGLQLVRPETNSPSCRHGLLFQLKAGLSNALQSAFAHHVVHFSSINSFRKQRPDEYQRLVDPTRYADLKKRPPLILCDSYGTKLAGDSLHPKDRRLTNKSPGATLLECASPCTAVFAVSSLPNDTVLILNLPNEREYTRHDLLRRVLYSVLSRMLPGAKLTLICSKPFDDIPTLAEDVCPWDAQHCSKEFID